MGGIPFFDLLVDAIGASMIESDEFIMAEEHAHHHYEMVFNFSPVPLRHTVSGRSYENDTPSILFRAPYTLHSTATLSRRMYKRYKVDFHPCVLTEFNGICELGRLREHTEHLIRTTEQQMAELEPLLLRLARAVRRGAPRREWTALLALLLCETNALLPVRLPPPPPAPLYIQEVLRYIVEHFSEPLTIGALSQRFYCSSAKLTRDFRAVTSLSLHEYVSAIRIARARLLLRDGASISQTAQLCGFSQDASFIRMFRRTCGMTPGEYRRKAAE